MTDTQLAELAAETLLTPAQAREQAQEAVNEAIGDLGAPMPVRTAANWCYWSVAAELDRAFGEDPAYSLDRARKARETADRYLGTQAEQDRVLGEALRRVLSVAPDGTVRIQRGDVLWIADFCDDNDESSFGDLPVDALCALADRLEAAP